MVRTLSTIGALLMVCSIAVVAQNTNSSTTKPRPRTTNTNTNANTASQTSKSTATAKPTAPTAVTKKSTAETPGSEAVLAAFNKILDGVRHANVNEVTTPYWNSKQLILFNNNGTVTRGWDQMRKNRESSYPD